MAPTMWYNRLQKSKSWRNDYKRHCFGLDEVSLLFGVRLKRGIEGRNSRDFSQKKIVISHSSKKESNWLQCQIDKNHKAKNKFKMLPLEISQLIFTWTYLSSPDKGTSRWQKIIRFIAFLIVFFGNFTSWAGALAFIIKYVSTDFENSLYAVFQLCAVGSVSYILIAAFFMRSQIRDIFRGLTQIYEASKTDRFSFQFF